MIKSAQLLIALLVQMIIVPLACLNFIFILMIQVVKVYAKPNMDTIK